MCLSTLRSFVHVVCVITCFQINQTGVVITVTPSDLEPQIKCIRNTRICLSSFHCSDSNAASALLHIKRNIALILYQQKRLNKPN